MGWARTLLLGDVGNRLDIEDCERDLQRIKREIRGAYFKDVSQDKMLEYLSKENSELKLCLAGLIRLLQSKQVFSKEELEVIIDAVDAEDGRSDKKLKGKIL